MKRRPPTYVYRLYDADDQVLYIGRSSALFARLSDHAMHQRWWSQVTKIVLERPDDIPAADSAEREAIRSEQPVHNKLRYAITEPKATPEQCSWPRCTDAPIARIVHEVETFTAPKSRRSNRPPERYSVPAHPRTRHYCPEHVAVQLLRGHTVVPLDDGCAAQIVDEDQELEDQELEDQPVQRLRGFERTGP